MNPDNAVPSVTELTQTIIVGRIEDLPDNSMAVFQLEDGNELAIYHAQGEFYATDNCCPHRGAPLSDGTLCGHVVECALHGWRFDVRSGECLTVRDSVASYRVLVEDGLIKVLINHHCRSPQPGNR